MMMPHRQPPEIDVLDLIDDEEWPQVASILADLHPADIAEIINRASSDAHEKLFAMVLTDLKADVLSELKGIAGEDILESLSELEISTIVQDMAPDDAADMLADLPDERSEQILDLMKKEDSEDVRELLKYEEDTAGGIMTPDVVAMKENQTVAEAIHEIAYFETDEPLYNVNVVDHGDVLTGFVDIWELLRERDKGRPLRDLAERDFVAATVDMDQEEVAHLLSKYHLTAIPVVDNIGTLVGRVTADDVIDVIEEEASEDIFRLAGSDDIELEQSSIFRTCLVRLPWLFITLFGGFITSAVMSRYQASISEIIILAAFVPVVMAMGGNTGIQSSTLIVRSIALGSLKGRSVARILLKEIMVGALMGLACSAIIGIWAHIFSGMSKTSTFTPFQISTVVAVAMFCAMTFAATAGALVPIVLNRLRIDAAVASGPFVTIMNDITALLIYFAVTVTFVNAFA